MKNRVVLRLLMAAVCALSAVATQPVQAQENGPHSDLIMFTGASNPGGLAGFAQFYETNPPESYMNILPAPTNGLINIGVLFFEDPAMTILSDEIWIQNRYWNFASDPDLVDFQSIGVATVGTLVEDGTSQDVSPFFGLPPGSMTVLSDVPEPTVTGLIAVGAGLLWYRRGHWRRASAVAPKR
jgi:hypothetical protein